MKIKKMKVGTNNLKKYLFLFIKGHLNNGLTLGEVDDILTPIVKEIFGIFLLRQSDTMTWKRDFKDIYPFLYNKNGEQIGSKEEEYLDEAAFKKWGKQLVKKINKGGD